MPEYTWITPEVLAAVDEQITRAVLLVEQGAKSAAVVLTASVSRDKEGEVQCSIAVRDTCTRARSALGAGSD